VAACKGAGLLSDASTEHALSSQQSAITKLYFADRLGRYLQHESPGICTGGHFTLP